MAFKKIPFLQSPSGLRLKFHIPNNISFHPEFCHNFHDIPVKGQVIGAMDKHFWCFPSPEGCTLPRTGTYQAHLKARHILASLVRFSQLWTSLNSTSCDDSRNEKDIFVCFVLFSQIWSETSSLCQLVGGFIWKRPHLNRQLMLIKNYMIGHDPLPHILFPAQEWVLNVPKNSN